MGRGRRGRAYIQGAGEAHAGLFGPAHMSNAIILKRGWVTPTNSPTHGWGLGGCPRSSKLMKLLKAVVRLITSRADTLYHEHIATSDLGFRVNTKSGPACMCFRGCRRAEARGT